MKKILVAMLMCLLVLNSYHVITAHAYDVTGRAPTEDFGENYHSRSSGLWKGCLIGGVIIFVFSKITR